MSPLTIETAKSYYHELKNIDMSKWTYGNYKSFYSAKDIENLGKRFTEQQLKELNDRGILLEDTFYLFKEFHTADRILKQTDAVLKLTLEDNYRFNYQMTLSSAENAGEIELNLVDLPSDKVGKYTAVNFPRYGEDWFSNQVLTTAYWLEIQSNRALLT